MRESRAKFLEQTPNRDPDVVAKIAEKIKAKNEHQNKLNEFVMVH